jgi:hypothetical protein
MMGVLWEVVGVAGGRGPGRQREGAGKFRFLKFGIFAVG